MLEKQKELTPRRPEPWAMLGPLYGMIGEEAPSADMRRTYYEKSLQALKQADKLCPNYRNVRRNIAAAYSHLGKPREAIRALREAAKVQDASWLYADMARNHVALGEVPQAEVTARKAVQYEPTNAEYHHLLAHALSSELKKEEALEEYRAAAHLNPAEAKYYVGMGYAYAYLGKRREAVEALRKALNLAVPGSNEEKLAQQGLRVLGQ
jgi:Flp pilus assembly protein TadD